MPKEIRNSKNNSDNNKHSHTPISWNHFLKIAPFLSANNKSTFYVERVQLRKHVEAFLHRPVSIMGPGFLAFASFRIFRPFFFQRQSVVDLETCKFPFFTTRVSSTSTRSLTPIRFRWKNRLGFDASWIIRFFVLFALLKGREFNCYWGNVFFRSIMLSW